MKQASSIQLIRNATLVLDYAGKKFLIDPMLAAEGAYPGLPGTVKAERRNPLVPMPVKPASLFDADAVILTHLHPDHWDEVAQQQIPKDKPIFVQNADDAAQVRSAGFKDIRIYEDGASFEGIPFQPTPCQHGPDEAYAVSQLAQILGKVSGLLFTHEGEKSIYIIGDSIWIPEIEQILTTHRPDIIVANTGAATLPGFNPIIMGKEDITRIHTLFPQSTIIAIHMEAINHCLLSRTELRKFVDQNGIGSHVIIPADGEGVIF